MKTKHIIQKATKVYSYNKGAVKPVGSHKKGDVVMGEMSEISVNGKNGKETFAVLKITPDTFVNPTDTAVFVDSPIFGGSLSETVRKSGKLKKTFIDTVVVGALYTGVGVASYHLLKSFGAGKAGKWGAAIGIPIAVFATLALISRARTPDIPKPTK